MAKVYSTRGLCYHISYSSDDLAAHFGVHIQTIREWVHRGLEPIDDHKPALFLGNHVMHFIDNMNNKRKITTRFNEFYCMSCHTTHCPQDHTITLDIKDTGFVRATGICGKTGAYIHKSYKLCDIPKLHQCFTVVDMLRLYDSETTTINTHILDTKKSTQTNVQTNGDSNQ